MLSSVLRLLPVGKRLGRTVVVVVVAMVSCCRRRPGGTVRISNFKLYRHYTELYSILRAVRFEILVIYFPERAGGSRLLLSYGFQKSVACLITVISHKDRGGTPLSWLKLPTVALPLVTGV